MKIKKYEGKTEQETIQKVKDDLGKDALILNIKKTNPKGIFKFFRQPLVEVMAALDETSAPKSNYAADYTIIEEQKKSIQNLESKLENMEGLLGKMVEGVSSPNQIQKTIHMEQKEDYRSTILQLFYDNLIKNEVIPELATKILENLDEIDENSNSNINNLVRIVYNRIIEMMGTPIPIELEDKKPKVIVFIGPTGVGKTTTIAKITAHFALNQQKKVGLITADTYRIAAVEQLKTYAEILGCPVEVIYSANEIQDTLTTFGDRDLIFVDTAGRSHKNKEQFQELKNLLSKIPKKEIFLVLSVTTKYRDILNILDAYETISDYNLIFTKTDETLSLGTILNVRYLTGKPLSYMAFGQNVPDDIELIRPEKIAKVLMGSFDE